MRHGQPGVRARQRAAPGPTGLRNAAGWRSYPRSLPGAAHRVAGGHGPAQGSLPPGAIRRVASEQRAGQARGRQRRKPYGGGPLDAHCQLAGGAGVVRPAPVHVGMFTAHGGGEAPAWRQRRLAPEGHSPPLPQVTRSSVGHTARARRTRLLRRRPHRDARARHNRAAREQPAAESGTRELRRSHISSPARSAAVQSPRCHLRWPYSWLCCRRSEHSGDPSETGRACSRAPPRDDVVDSSSHRPAPLDHLSITAHGSVDRRSDATCPARVIDRSNHTDLVMSVETSNIGTNERLPSLPGIIDAILSACACVALPRCPLPPAASRARGFSSHGGPVVVPTDVVYGRGSGTTSRGHSRVRGWRGTSRRQWRLSRRFPAGAHFHVP